eukprot:1157730-Pelagomonas_calceolata.AAC.2
MQHRQTQTETHTDKHSHSHRQKHTHTNRPHRQTQPQPSHSHSHRYTDRPHRQTQPANATNILAKRRAAQLHPQPAWCNKHRKLHEIPMSGALHQPQSVSACVCAYTHSQSTAFCMRMRAHLIFHGAGHDHFLNQVRICPPPRRPKGRY